MIKPFFFINEAVTVVDFSQMPDTHVRSRALCFTRDAVLKLDGASFHNTRIARSSLDEWFQNSWIGRCSPTDRLTKQLNLALLEHPPWGFPKDPFYRTSLSKVADL